MAFVVITHLSPSHESMLAEILGRTTTMPVVDARDGELVEAQHVYVLPPSAILTIREGRLRLRRTAAADRERAPIDVFFNSLAEDQGEHAIGIVLSGGGSDGTLGLKAIKENGGLTIAQGSNLTRPRFAEMPSSAVAAGFVDLLLPVEDIPDTDHSAMYAIGAPSIRNGRLLRSPTFIGCCANATGHDFSDYKDRTFQRRVQRRMQVVQTTKLDRLRRAAADGSGRGRRPVSRPADRGYRFLPRSRGLRRARDPGHPAAVRGQGRRRRGPRLGRRLRHGRGGLFDRDPVARAHG